MGQHARAMMPPTFLNHLSRQLSRKYELVHVESGAVLGSRVEIGEVRRPWVRPTGRGWAMGGEPSLLVAQSGWTHTCLSLGPVDLVFVSADGTVLKTLREVKPWRIAAARGAQVVIEASPGFIERTETSPGDRLALREAQAARPLRDVAPVRTGVDRVPASVRIAVDGSLPDAPRDTDLDFDPWDLGSEEVVEAKPAPPAALDRRAAEARTPAPQNVPPRPAPKPGAEPQAGRRTPAGLAHETPVVSRTPAGPAPRRTPARPGFKTGVDLVRLVARQTPIAWFESVAIAQEIITVLLGRGDVETPIDLHSGDAAITPDGSIELRRDVPAGMPPVAQVARILLTLLAEAQTLPVQLRLLALQEVSPSPSCRTLLELSTRLAHFERPGRAAIIREVYERFSRLPARDSESRAEAAPPVALTAPARPERWWEPVPRWLARTRWWRSPRAQAAAALLVLALVVSVALVRLWPLLASPPAGAADRRGPVARVVGTAAETVSDGAVTGAKAVGQWMGLVATDRPTAAAATTAEAAPAASAAAAPRRARARPPRNAAGPASAAGRVGAGSPGPDTTIYSAVDTEVVPPTIVRSRLPASPPQGTPSADIPQVEVVVSPTGEVESVKLVTQPGVQPAMMLSAIKAWRFEPATKDGQAVRYRLVVRLTNQ